MLNLYTCLILCWLEISISLPDFGNTQEIPGMFELEFQGYFGMRKPQTVLEKIEETALEEFFGGTKKMLQDRLDLENLLIQKGRVISLNQRKTDTSLTRNLRTDPLIHSMELLQLPFDFVSNLLYEKYNLSMDNINNDLAKLQITGRLGNENIQNCQIRTDRCDPHSKYRTITGQCNNLQNPKWGSARTCHSRLLPARYVGTSGFRVSMDGGPLPEPRILSLNVHNHLNRPTNYANHLFTIFGQILDHDMTQTATTTTGNNQAVECCPVENSTHPKCAPITIFPDDPFYSQFRNTCMNFVRSVICPTCTLGPRQIMNAVTSFIDASFVYGSLDNETRILRRKDGSGKLNTQSTPYGELMPQSTDPENDQCSNVAENQYCFEAGDFRVNENTILTSLHTIFLREHNRLATELKRLNPHWDGDRLFLESRRILGAQMQAIAYKEYLPIVLSDERMDYYKLKVGEWTNYNPKENPTTLLEFVTAAFRFGHTIVSSVIANTPLSDTNQPRLLRNDYFQPFPLYRGFAGPIIKGSTSTPAQWFDRHHSPDVTNYLYRMRGDPTGLDLAAITIMRGRDHGLPTYVEAVRYCSKGHFDITSFNDLVRYDLMTEDQKVVLEQNHKYVEDIDLATGIFCESYTEGSVVGPTAACIIGLQFNKLKFADRFYFEHLNQAGSFTVSQVEELRRVTLSQIICLNTNIKSLPMTALLFTSKKNPLIACRQQRGVKLFYWKE